MDPGLPGIYRTPRGWWPLAGAGGYLMGHRWSAVIVSVIRGIAAAVLGLRGRKELKAINGLPRTTQTLPEIPQTLRPREEIR
ncbi:MAG: phage holin family protein [Actinomycetota bacterium]|nr:phage holin family protein [Actinomycetota bacterium]